MRIESTEDLPRHVRGDPTRLQQIITNLLVNSVKFTEKGSNVLDAVVTDQRQIRFSVSDYGMGMTVSQSLDIFERFVPSDTSITRRFGGTGLGLSICQQLVKQMDGESGVESEPDAGSLFWFEIPLPEHQPEGSKAHILVAEDNAVNRLIVSKLLKKLGHSCHLVENSAVASQQ